MFRGIGCMALGRARDGCASPTGDQIASRIVRSRRPPVIDRPIASETIMVRTAHRRAVRCPRWSTGVLEAMRASTGTAVCSVLRDATRVARR
jgi:hypothetical protein